MTDQQQPKRYSRSARIKGLPQPGETGETPAETTTDAPRVVEHAKKGFTALQKVIALISTCLSVIVASITISNNLNKDKAATTPSTETRVTHIYKTETTVVSGSQSQPSSTQSQQQAPSRTEAGSAQVVQQTPATTQTQASASSATPSTSSRSASSQTSSSTTTSTASSSSEATNSSTTTSTQSSAAHTESATMTGSSEVVGIGGSSGE